MNLFILSDEGIRSHVSWVRHSHEPAFFAFHRGALGSDGADAALNYFPVERDIVGSAGKEMVLLRHEVEKVEWEGEGVSIFQAGEVEEGGGLSVILCSMRSSQFSWKADVLRAGSCLAFELLDGKLLVDGDL